MQMAGVPLLWMNHVAVYTHTHCLYSFIHGQRRLFAYVGYGDCKSNPQWDTASHLLEWLLPKRQEITSAGEDLEKRESYTLSVEG